MTSPRDGPNKPQSINIRSEIVAIFFTATSFRESADRRRQLESARAETPAPTVGLPPTIGYESTKARSGVGALMSISISFMYLTVNSRLSDSISSSLQTARIGFLIKTYLIRLFQMFQRTKVSLKFLLTK